MGYQCVLLKWDKTEAEEIYYTTQFIEKSFAEEVLDVVPTYREIAIYLHHSTNRDQLMKLLKKQLPVKQSVENTTASPIYRIPVCYDREKGMDLERLAQEKSLSKEQLIQLHTAPTYTIHFLGFLPGFPYLSGLTEKLHHPRLAQPRTKVPAGSVGIAANQTGVYPQESPGGWNIIGQTPVPLFDIHQSPPALLHHAKRLQFYEVTNEIYQQIAKEVSNNNYQIEKSHD
jgi:inhibitor of KinA